MNEILAQFARLRIIPVVVIDGAANAVPLARALLEGGLPVMEITFRTQAAKNALQQIAKECPDVLLGAGTVLSVEQVKTAVDAGAQYIVSPGLNRSVVEYCQTNNILITPGAITPTELGTALEMGVSVVKFFPAEPIGGLSYLKAISAPFGGLKFIPTGGIDATNLSSYLKFPKVIACGGSWMVKSDLISGRNFGEVKRLTEEAVKVCQSTKSESPHN